MDNKSKKRGDSWTKEHLIFRGFGIEHEQMFFFHSAPELASLGGEGEFPLCKKQDGVKVFAPSKIIKDLLNNVSMADLPEVIAFLQGLPALEQSGRKCGGKWVLKRAGDDLLVEFANRGWFEKFVVGKAPNKNFDHFVDDIIKQELVFRQIIKDYMPESAKVSKRLGMVAPVSVGMLPNILVPKNTDSPFQFKETLHTDYTGSYHMTLTLPFPLRESWEFTKKENELFVEIHRNFANMIQWLEPLMCSALFTPDLNSAGPQPIGSAPKVRGSFRVFNLGWGSFAGSDLTKLNKGISRYANIKPYWRKDLSDMEGADAIKLCDKVRLEPGAISAVGSDFRTFGSKDLLRPWHRESGMPMVIPNGLELRILDHFDPMYLYFVVQLIALIAEHSRNKNIGAKYVYRNKAWIGAMNKVMRDGWRARVPEEYIKLISELFDVEFDKSVKRAFDLFESLYSQLWNKYSLGLWSNMLVSPEILKLKMPVPNVNRLGYEIGWMTWLDNNRKEQTIFKKWILSLPEHIHSWDDWVDYWQIFLEELPKKYQNKDTWGKQDKDIIYYLESLGIFEINHQSGESFKSKDINIELLVSCIDTILLYYNQMPLMDKIYRIGLLGDEARQIFENSSLFKLQKFYFNEILMKSHENTRREILNRLDKLYEPQGIQYEIGKNVAPGRKKKQHLSHKNRELLMKSIILPIWHLKKKGVQLPDVPEQGSSNASNLTKLK